MAAYKAYDKRILLAEYYLEERRKMHGVKRVLLRSKPEISTNRKHIRLKKSMTLPDDTLEYWGFYLLKGALVHLKFCSRYDGSRILVVKGQRELQTCGLLDHNKNKVDANFARGHDQAKVFFEDITEIAENISLENLGRRIQTEAITFINSNDDSMELENKTDEDLSEENVVKFKKKLKKDSLISSRHRKTETEVNERTSGIKEHSNRRSKESAKVSISDNEDKSYEYERRKKQLYEQLYKRRIRRDHKSKFAQEIFPFDWVASFIEETLLKKMQICNIR
uniref:E3 ubiquitin-protein ligase APD1-4 N-terminal domain-containing protein n=1 Tax=Glossina morsitans morsitans TaxID=37546 RepID=A0A1B0GE67_GLOMM